MKLEIGKNGRTQSLVVEDKWFDLYQRNRKSHQGFELRHVLTRCTVDRIDYMEAK